VSFKETLGEVNVIFSKFNGIFVFTHIKKIKKKLGVGHGPPQPKGSSATDLQVLIFLNQYKMKSS